MQLSQLLHRLRPPHMQRSRVLRGGGAIVTAAEDAQEAAQADVAEGNSRKSSLASAASRVSWREAVVSISAQRWYLETRKAVSVWAWARPPIPRRRLRRSEEHTSELQSQFHLVC